MAQGRLTPRQKMINMMYLVLTALLALNVSKEIINAFVTVNESLDVSKKNIQEKNNKTYAEFADAMKYDAAKYKDANDKAQIVKAASDELVKYIEQLKDSLIRHSDEVSADEKTPELRAMDRKDNYDVPTEMMVGSTQDGKGLKASELKGKIESYRGVLIKSVPSKEEDLKALLNTTDPDPKSAEYKEDGKRTWEMSKFYHNPVVASVALLTKFQNDVRNSESQVVDYLYSSIGKFEAKMNQFDAAVIPNSTVVTIGNEYEAQVFLTATSSTLAPDVFIGATVDADRKNCKGCEGTPLMRDEKGISMYSARPSSEGEQKWSGVIRVKKPDNTFDYYPFQTSYIAQKPNSVASADKMNVLFVGLDNPVSISVPGVPTNQVRPVAEGCTLSPGAGGGHYIANTNPGATSATIKVNAEINGKMQPMGSFAFRVKSVPPATPTIGGKFESGNINKNVLLASSLIPIMKDFYFDLFWEITEFKMSIAGKGVDYQEFQGKGNQLDDKMKAAIGKARPGAKVYFEYIKGRMIKTKDNSTKSLAAMTFVIQ